MQSTRQIEPMQTEDNVMVVNFNIARAKTKKYGRCLLYFGLVILIINFMSILYSILALFLNLSNKSDQRKQDEEMFGTASIYVLEWMDFICNCAEFAQGALMIIMTKEVIK